MALQGSGKKTATANTLKAMRRSAETRRCPKCGRGSAVVRQGRTGYCRWDDCTYTYDVMLPDTETPA